MKDYKNTPEGKETARLYADIIGLSRPASDRPKMDLTHRAKIFSPYDALRGFDEAIEDTDEKNRRIRKGDFSDEQKDIISEKLSRIEKGMKLTVQYFLSDPDGFGECMTAEGTVTKIDPICQILEIQDRIPFAAAGRLEKAPPIRIRFDEIMDIKKPPA